MRKAIAKGVHHFLKKNEPTVVWAASSERSYEGILENSFEHSEIRIISNRQMSEGTTKNAHLQKNARNFIFNCDFVVNKRHIVQYSEALFEDSDSDKKRATLACHSECLHNGIILIVYILQICWCIGSAFFLIVQENMLFLRFLSKSLHNSRKNTTFAA